MRRHGWSPLRDEVVRACARGDRTWSSGARELGCTQKSVRDRASKLGLVLATRRRVGKIWTTEQDALLRLHSERPHALPLSKLCARLVCSRVTIYARAKVLGLQVHLSDSGRITREAAALTPDRDDEREQDTPPAHVGEDLLLQRLIEVCGDRTYGTRVAA